MTFLALAFVLAAAPAQAEPAAEDRARVELIERVSRSVVHVKAEQSEPLAVNTARSGRDRVFDDMLDSLGGPRKPEEGTGFVIDSARGLVLTAAHIVDEAKTITVNLPGGTSARAELAGLDVDGGIALLRVSGSLPALPLAEREPRAGETAIIVGWMIPLKSVMPVEGMVMGDAPGAEASPLAPPFAKYIALDAVIPNGGFGGSPAVDSSGKVVGMVSAIYGRDYGPGSLTMIISAAGMAKDLAQLAAAGRISRSAIGMKVDCPKGNCFVDSIDAGSAAAKAGLRQRDALIAVDSVKVASVPAVQRAIGRKPIGAPVELTVYRDGQLVTLSAITVARP